MSSEKLNKARVYEQKGALKVPEEQRPAFPPVRADRLDERPERIFFLPGRLHLFYQYNPYSVCWDAMHWGHAKTEDFIRWEYLPAALAPDEKYDEIGVFSGSAIEADGKHVLLYTGVSELENADGKKEIRQVQCLAEGDGTDYEMIPENPVIDASLLPREAAGGFPGSEALEGGRRILCGCRQQSGGWQRTDRAVFLRGSETLGILYRPGPL